MGIIPQMIILPLILEMLMGIGLLEMLLAKKADSATVIDLIRKVESLEKQVAELETGNFGRSEKVFYTVKDLSELMTLAENTIRKNYISTGIIKARIPSGSKSLIIDADEFYRVKDIVERYGVSYLRRMTNG